MNSENVSPGQPPEGPPQPLEQGGKANSTFLSKLSLDDLVTLNEEIAGMARAGLPLDQGLSALAREMGRGKLQRVTQEIALDLQSGHTLAQALERQNGRVPPFYASLVTAGVRTGKIGEVLSTLTVYARSLADLKSTVISALFYPAMVLILSFFLFAYLCFNILPKFEQIFQEFKLKLPLVTQLVLFLGRHPWEVLVLPVVGILACAGLIKWVSWSRSDGRAAAFVLYSLPVVGTMIRSARLAAFADLLGILVDHEVPLPEAFRLAGQASSDPYLTVGARQVQEDLSHGLTLSQSLRQRQVVPELVAWMTGLGENRGHLGQTLHEVAVMYRRQVELRAGLLRNILPPLVIILTAGILVALFIFALMMPLFSLIQNLSGN